MQSIRIRHQRPGRVRLFVPLIRQKGFHAKMMSRLQQTEGITSVRCNTACRSVIILFEGTQIEAGDIQTLIQQITPVSCELLPKTDLCTKTQTRSSMQSIRPQARRFALLTALSSGIFVRNLIVKTALAESLFSPLGLITAVASIPLLKEGIAEARKKKELSLHSFLGGSCLLAVVFGEAMTALEILWITSGAELLTAHITDRSRRAIRDIIQTTTNRTYLLRDGVEVEIPVEDLKIGDVIVLHTGEKVPADAEVISGFARLNEAPFTGHTIPAEKGIGTSILAGTIVDEGLIHARVLRVGSETYLSYIVRQVEDTLHNRADIELVADQLARNLLRVGLISTGLTLLLTADFMRAFTVLLVMACPCATILAASTAVAAALSSAARQGILIKGGRYLEKFGETDVFCFDKTGTLTAHEPQLTEMITCNEIDKEELLRLTASAELHNRHPLALAIKHEAQLHDIELLSHAECDFEHGKGVRALVNGDEILVGSKLFMTECGVDLDGLAERGHHMAERGLMVTYSARNKQPVGLFGFENRLRPGLNGVLNKLRQDGVKHFIMLTGDHRYVAEYLADELGFEKCYHSLLPADKAAIIEQLDIDGHDIVMIGDGINDSAALARANIGVAMGAGGSDVAIETADIALIHEHIEGLLVLRKLSRKTVTVAKQNFAIATSTNIIGAILGATGLMHPVMAGAIHIAHTLGIMLNSGRLLKTGALDSVKCADCHSQSISLATQNYEDIHIQSITVNQNQEGAHHEL